MASSARRVIAMSRYQPLPVILAAGNCTSPGQIRGVTLISCSRPRRMVVKPGQCRCVSTTIPRSEERRVGKECRSRWSPYQAEDGIRDGRVTGVQTCALPILNGFFRPARYRNVSLPAFACDPGSGQLYIAWSDKGGDADILFSTSKDGGKTWSVPLRVNDDPKIGRASCRERV